MKAAVFLYVAGLLLVVVFGGGRPKCGRNMETTKCFPCNQVCNQPIKFCPALCTLNQTSCVCKSGFVLPDVDCDFCIPEEDCPPRPCD